MKIVRSILVRCCWLEDSKGKRLTEKIKEPISTARFGNFYVIKGDYTSNTWVFDRNKEKLLFKHFDEIQYYQIFSNIYCFRLSRTNKVFIYDEGCNLISDDIFIDKATCTPTGLIPAAKNNKWGYVDKDIVWKVLPKYIRCSSFNKDGVAVAKNNDSLFVIIDSNGIEILKLDYEDVIPLENGLLKVVTKDKLCGVLDSTGKEILPTIYKNIYLRISADYMFIKSSDGIGLSDNQGNVLLEPEYYEIFEKSDRFIAKKTITKEVMK